MPLLIDTCNLYHTIHKKFTYKDRLSYKKYLIAVEKLFGPQTHKIAFVSYPGPSVDPFVTSLKSLGFTIKTKVPHTLEGAAKETDFKVTDLCVEMTIKALKMVNDEETIIIGSSDRRLESLLNVLKRRAGAVGVFAAGVPHAFEKYACCSEIRKEHLNGS